jgi:hypothetical protein
MAGLYMLGQRGKRQLDVATAYSDVSRRLGLDVDTRGVSLHGHVERRRIWIGDVMVGHGPKRRTMTWGVVDLTRPLGLGLLVRRKGPTLNLLRRRAAPDSTVGDPDLDKVLSVQADDPARATQMFSSDVRATITDLMARWPEIAITDDAVRVHLSRPEANTDRLQRLVDTMLDLADALEHARHAIEPPSQLAGLHKSWGDIASRYSLDLEPWLPGLAGMHQGRYIVVSPRRTTDGYCADLHLWFGAHSPTGLQLQPQTRPGGYWNVGQDIRTADDAVDHAYVIKGWDPGRVVDLLTDDARTALQALSELGVPDINDKRLHIEQLSLEPEVIEETLQLAHRLAEALGW